MSSDRSWVHSLFWSKRIGAGDYKFCKVCYPQEEEQPSVDEVKYLIDNQFLPSHAFKGCVQYVSSPSGLANHIRSKHPAQVPDHIQLQRSAGTLGNKNAKLDLELLTLWAQHIVIGSLREVDLIDDPHVRAVLAPRLPGLAHEDRLQKEVDSCIFAPASDGSLGGASVAVPWFVSWVALRCPTFFWVALRCPCLICSLDGMAASGLYLGAASAPMLGCVLGGC